MALKLQAVDTRYPASSVQIEISAPFGTPVVDFLADYGQL